VVGIMGRLTAR